MAAAQRENEANEPAEGAPSTGEASQPSEPGGVERSTAANRLAARRAAKAAAKASKRGTQQVPDSLIQTVGSATAVYQRSSRMIWSLIAATGLIGVTAIAWNAHVEKRGKEATDVLETGLRLARAEIVTTSEEIEPVTGEAEDETFPSRVARAERAQAAFADVVKKFPSSEAAIWARLGEANALYDLGKHAEAERAYAQLAQGDVGPYVTLRALEGEAFALEAQGKHEEAQQRFVTLAKIDNGSYQLPADYHRARMLILRGQEREAAKALETLLKAERERAKDKPSRFPSTVSDAETLLAELSVKLDDPKLRAELPANRPGASQPGGSSQDLVDALRMQLEAGGAKGISQETLDALKLQLGGNQPITIPVSPDGKGEAPAAPAAELPQETEPAPSAP